MAARDNVIKINEHAEELTEKLNYEKEKHAKGQKELEEKQQCIEESKKEYDVLCAELNKCQTEYGVLERKDVQLQEDMKHNKTKRSKLKTKLKKVCLFGQDVYLFNVVCTS